jgi:hypothetical protein
MSRIFLPNPANNKRLPVRLDYTYDIIYYGRNNVYPQEQEELRLVSPLIKSSTEILEDFINGSGWEFNNEFVINDQGHTTRDMLNLVAMDYSRYNGFAIWVGGNPLGGVTELRHIPFEYCRLGLPNQFGDVDSIAVSNNWERDSAKLPQGGRLTPVYYPMFNHTTLSEGVLDGTSEGQIFYFSGLEVGKYPLSTFDVINQTGESDEATQRYERNSIKRGFNGASVFRYPGKFDTIEEKNEIIRMVERWNGEDAPGVTVVQTDEDFSGELIETIDSNNDSNLFGTTLTSLTNRTLSTFRIPPPIFGQSPENSVFTQLAYQESYVVYNAFTRNKRNAVARVFEKVLLHWAGGELQLGRIIENEFAIQGQADTTEANPNFVNGLNVQQ